MKKFRSRSRRMPRYNYGNPGYYFITICTKNRLCWFSDASDKLALNSLGKTATNYWTQIPKHFFHVQIGQFVIMPNHLHGILEITACRSAPWRGPAGIHPLTPGALGTVINHYKGAVKRWANRNGYPNFFWQQNYFERLLRNDQSIKRVSQYIKDNPSQWELDPLACDGNCIQ